MDVGVELGRPYSCRSLSLSSLPLQALGLRLGSQKLRGSSLGLLLVPVGGSLRRLIVPLLVVDFPNRRVIMKMPLSISHTDV